MIREFEYEGEWWLPEQPEQRIKGTFKFNHKEGASLHLIGLEQERIKEIDKTKIIQGFSADGKRITLYDCFLKKTTIHYPGMVECSLYANFVFVGWLFEKAEDIKFKSVWVSLLHLDDWVNISGFKMLPPKKGRFTIKYKRPKDFHANISKDLKVIVRFGVEYPRFSFPQKEASIKQNVYLGIIPAESKSLEEYLEIIYHMKNFLTLAITKPVYPLTIEGTIETNENKMQNTVGIFYKLPGIPEPYEVLTFLDMLFTFRDVSKRFSFFLKNWFRKAELLEPVYALYFGTLYRPGMYITNEFLNLAQAIESYHRRTMRNYELPDDQHKKRIGGILGAAPNEHREWLEKKLQWSNEPSLRKRLRDILKSCPEVLDRVIKNKKTFINKTIDTRNYWTHFEPDLKEKATKNGEIFKLTSRLRILLQSCLLKELGFSPDSVGTLISKLIQRKYQFLVENTGPRLPMAL